MYTITKIYHLLSQIVATPNPNISAVSFIIPAKPRDTPDLILTFSVSIAPPTYVTCQVDSIPVDISTLSHEVTDAEYLPSNTTSPVTNVALTLKARQAGNYQCTVSVFRASGDNLTDVQTPPISILGQGTIQTLHELYS